MGGIASIDLKNPKCQFHVFWKMLIPYTRFSRIYKTDIKEFSDASFPTFSIFTVSEISKNKISIGYSGIQSQAQWCLGVMDISTSPEKHENADISDSWNQSNST